ncbi:hypothetical protein Enr13x_34590 [Stieleria neptunia]|uniref:CARDB domain-containing protein n=1 Tax=Stieleria neptunia TaxID=2527979 RepID=A0A518HRX4_9BACT|nr:CARDB domain-containing protein [Stieleria neptunia]QDV43602.1 hypothetical protein Enr13x_34590 [Stieleria neptunia]
MDFRKSRQPGRLEKLEDRRLFCVSGVQSDVRFLTGAEGQSGLYSKTWNYSEFADTAIAVEASGATDAIFETSGSLNLNQANRSNAVLTEDDSYADFHASIKPFREIDRPEGEHWIIGSWMKVTENVKPENKPLCTSIDQHLVYRFIPGQEPEANWETIVIPPVAAGDQVRTAVKVGVPSRHPVQLMTNQHPTIEVSGGINQFWVQYDSFDASESASQVEDYRYEESATITVLAGDQSIGELTARATVVVADLIGTNFEVDQPDSIDWGSELTVKYEVKNQGIARTKASQAAILLSADASVQLDSDQPLAWVRVPALNPGESKSSEITITLPTNPPSGFESADGLHLGISLDSDQDVPEWDWEHNNENQAIGKDKVALSVDRPDLIARRITRYSDDAGGGIEIEYDVESAGPFEGEVPVSVFWASGRGWDDRVGHSLLDETIKLQPGQSIRVPADLLKNPHNDVWYMQLVVDPDKQISELNESNNLITLDPADAMYSHELLEYISREIIYRDESNGWTSLLDHQGQLLSQVPQQTRVVNVEGWKVDKVWSATDGFFAAAFTSRNLDPVLVFRGTEPSEPTDWLADAHFVGVGYGQYSRSRNTVLNWLAGRTGVAFAGHSLGGALAQWFAADATAQATIGDVITFNSPGISQTHAEKFLAEKAGDVVHHYVNGDVVTMAGEAFLEGNSIRYSFEDTAFRFDKWHSLPLLVDRVGTSPGEFSSHRTIGSSVRSGTAWLNSPYYFHTDTSYLLALTAANGLILSGKNAFGLENASFLLLRSTFEQERQKIGKFLQSIGLFDLPSDPNQIAVPFPKLDFKIAGNLDVKAEGLQVIYDGPSDSLTMQGNVELAGFYKDAKVIGDFSGDNFIRYTPKVDGPTDTDLNDGWEVAGRLSLVDFELSQKWILKEAFLKINTISNQVAAGGVMQIPSGIELSASVEVLNGKLNAIELKADKIDKPIGVSGAYLQSIGGELKHLAASDPNPTVFSGSVGATYGPAIAIPPLPNWLGGYEFEGSIVEIEAETIWDRNHASLAGEVDVMLGMATADAEAELNWSEGYLSAEGVFDILGIATGQMTIRGDSQLNLHATADVSVDLPPALAPFAYVENGQVRLQYLHDATHANDYISVWGNVRVPLFGDTYDWGIKVALDGSVSQIGFDEVDAEDSSRLRVVSPGESERVDHLSHEKVFDLPDTDGVAIFEIKWDESSSVGDYELLSPRGDRITSQAIVEHSDLSVVSSMGTDHSIVIAARNVDPGQWTLRSMGSGRPSLRSWVSLDAHDLHLGHVRQDDDFVVIEFDASDLAPDSRIAFYLSTSPDDASGTYLGESAPDQPAINQFQFSKQGFADGDYFLHAIVSSNHAVPAVQTSGRISISGYSDPISPWRNRLRYGDVNADGNVSPLDALIVINELGRHGPSINLDAHPYDPETPFYDVSGDRIVSTLDALHVINAIAIDVTGRNIVTSEQASPAKVSDILVANLAARRCLLNAVPKSKTEASNVDLAFRQLAAPTPVFRPSNVNLLINAIHPPAVQQASEPFLPEQVDFALETFEIQCSDLDPTH